MRIRYCNIVSLVRGGGLQGATDITQGHCANNLVWACLLLLREAGT